MFLSDERRQLQAAVRACLEKARYQTEAPPDREAEPAEPSWTWPHSIWSTSWSRPRSVGPEAACKMSLWCAVKRDESCSKGQLDPPQRPLSSYDTARRPRAGPSSSVS